MLLLITVKAPAPPTNCPAASMVDSQVNFPQESPAGSQHLRLSERFIPTYFS